MSEIEKAIGLTRLQWKARAENAEAHVARLEEALRITRGVILEANPYERLNPHWKSMIDRIDEALAGAGEPAEHDPKTGPCPTCGFQIREVERPPFQIEDEDLSDTGEHSEIAPSVKADEAQEIYMSGHGDGRKEMRERAAKAIEGALAPQGEPLFKRIATLPDIIRALPLTEGKAEVTLSDMAWHDPEEGKADD